MIGSDLTVNSRLLHGWDFALEETDEPYPWGSMFGRAYRDVWAIDTETGERRQILTRVRHAWPGSGAAGWSGGTVRPTTVSTSAPAQSMT